MDIRGLDKNTATWQGCSDWLRFDCSARARRFSKRLTVKARRRRYREEIEAGFVQEAMQPSEYGLRLNEENRFARIHAWEQYAAHRAREVCGRFDDPETEDDLYEDEYARLTRATLEELRQERYEEDLFETYGAFRDSYGFDDHNYIDDSDDWDDEDSGWDYAYDRPSTIFQETLAPQSTFHARETERRLRVSREYTERMFLSGAINPPVEHDNYYEDEDTYDAWAGIYVEQERAAENTQVIDLNEMFRRNGLA